MDEKKFPDESEPDVTTGHVDLPPSPLRRKFGILNIVAVAYNISNSWVAVATSFVIAIQAGGAVSLLYGVIAVAAAMACTGITLAELASVYPTAGGQYHFTSILAGRRWNQSLSYGCGLVAVAAWITLASSIVLASVETLMAMVIEWNDGYNAQPWHLFCVYQLSNIVIVVYNVFLTNRTIWVYNAGFILSLSTFLAITIASPSMSSDKQMIDSHAVWTKMENGSNGWPDGIAFLTGLTTPQFMLSGLDASLHLAEECLEPKRVVPRAVMTTVLVGFITAFTFSVASVYSCKDVSALDDSSGIPIYQLWIQALDSRAGSTVLMAAMFTVTLVALNAVHQTASRMTWSFARDNALLGSKWLSRVHPTLNVPVYALVFNGVVVMLLGVVYVCSTNAFNAFINNTVILAQISYAIPAVILLVRRRSTQYLPSKRVFKVPDTIGYVANVICIAWAVILTVFFCFPTEFPVTPGNMNYSVVVLAVILALGVANWFVYARKRYQGPTLSLD